MSRHPSKYDTLFSKGNISSTTIQAPCFSLWCYSCLNYYMHLSCESREKGQTPNNVSHILSSLEIYQKVTYICHKKWQWTCILIQRMGVNVCKEMEHKPKVWIRCNIQSAKSYLCAYEAIHVQWIISTSESFLSSGLKRARIQIPTYSSHGNTKPVYLSTKCHSV